MQRAKMAAWQEHSGLWLRELSYGYYLAVVEDEPGKWIWEHRGGPAEPGGTRPLLARSPRRASSAATARRHADRYFAAGLGGNPRQKFTMAPAGLNGGL